VSLFEGGRNLLFTLEIILYLAAKGQCLAQREGKEVSLCVGREDISLVSESLIHVSEMGSGLTENQAPDP